MKLDNNVILVLVCLKVCSFVVSCLMGVFVFLMIVEVSVIMFWVVGLNVVV